MTRKQIREFIREGVDLMTPSIEFGSGRLSEFASIRSHKYPAVWMLLGVVSGTNPSPGAPSDQWEIELIIAQKDQPDSPAELYEQIIDLSDEIAQKLMYKYNQIVTTNNLTYKLVTLSNRKRTPFVKDYSPDCITGVKLTFTMTVPDRTNVC